MTRAKTSMVLRIDQVLGDAPECHCGKSAELLVLTEPDGEPGYVCRTHAYEWIDLSLAMVERIWPRKDDDASA